MPTNIIIREFTKNDIAQVLEVWNEIVEAGISFPQIEKLDPGSAVKFFAEQSFTGVAENTVTQQVLGLYILHPNNIGRCGHIANASYAVKSAERGQHIGEQLVLHSLAKGKELGFRIMQFNAVVKMNYAAIHLYEKLGFTKLGIIPGGFLMKNGTYEDMIPFYKVL